MVLGTGLTIVKLGITISKHCNLFYVVAFIGLFMQLPYLIEPRLHVFIIVDCVWQPWEGVGRMRRDVWRGLTKQTPGH